MGKTELPKMPYWDGPLAHPFYSKVVKRALDFLLALILLIPGLLMMIPLAIWVKLDELPQLFNILKGDMSFVGPRPELRLYTEQYTGEQQCILWVRPGVTDRSSIVYIAQDEIVGEEDPVANFEKLILPEKNRLRVEYAKSQSFGLDCRLLAETVKGVFGKAEDMARERAK